MRPRKKILLIDADETRRGILAYALDIHRFEVHQCETVMKGNAYLAGPLDFDLILAQWPLPPDEFTALWRSTETRFLVVLRPEDTYLDAVGTRSPTMEDLLNQIKTATVRKRGPKRGFRVKQLTAA